MFKPSTAPKSRLHSLRWTWIFLALGLVGIGCWYWFSAVSAPGHEPAKAVDTQAVMAVEYAGGLCDGPCPRAVANVFADGTFQGHSRISGSEMAQLEQVITATDFKKYAQNDSRARHCESDLDGQDEILYFPMRYGTSFAIIPCRLSIPTNDAAFEVINGIIERHNLPD